MAETSTSLSESWQPGNSGAHFSRIHKLDPLTEGVKLPTCYAYLAKYGNTKSAVRFAASRRSARFNRALEKKWSRLEAKPIRYSRDQEKKRSRLQAKLLRYSVPKSALLPDDDAFYFLYKPSMPRGYTWKTIRNKHSEDAL